MTKLICLLLVLFSLPAFAQIKFAGTITDAETGELLPYATIGIPNKSVGTIAGLAGDFSLIIPEKFYHDTLTISYIGYQAIRLPVTDIKDSKMSIKLQPLAINLREVVVTENPQPTSVKEIGINNGKTHAFSSLDQHYFSSFYEVAVDETYKLKILRIYIGSWPNKNTMLRIKIQAPDSANPKIPGHAVHQKEIILKPKKEKKWIEADLKEHNVFVRQPGFFVTLELISSGVAADQEPNISHTIGLKYGKEVPPEITHVLIRQHLFGKWYYNTKSGTPMIGFEVGAYEKVK